MPYRFKRSESVEENVKRIAREEIDEAVKQLRSGNDKDEAVHEVRKSLKKVRALLRIVRPELGRSFDRENTHLRDTGRKLSSIRDAAAIVEAWDGLGKQQPPSVRRALVLHQKHADQELATPDFIRSLASALMKTRKSTLRWRLRHRGFRAIGLGLLKTYRDGRKALATARKSGTREDFHEFRKRVKDHWYHIRLLEKLWTDVMQAYEHSLKDLEDALGNDLNFSILQERLPSVLETAGAAAKLDSVNATIDGKRKELRAHALEVGAKVYSQKPRDFIRQMEKLWSAT